MDFNRNAEREKFLSRILNSRNDKPIGDFKERFAHPFLNFPHGYNSPHTLENTEIDMHDRQLHEKSMLLPDRHPSFMGTGHDYTTGNDEYKAALLSAADIHQTPFKNLDSMTLLQDRPKPLDIFNRTAEEKPTANSSVGEKEAELSEVTTAFRDADSTASLHGEESGFTLTPTDSHGSFEVIEEGVSDVEQEQKETLLQISSSGAVMDEFRTAEEDSGRISKSLSTLTALQQLDGYSAQKENVETADESDVPESKTYSSQDHVSRMAVDLERLRSDDHLPLDTESIFGPIGIYPLTGYSTIQTARSRLDSESELDFSWLNPKEPTSDIANILTALDDLRNGVHSLSRNDFTQNEPYPTGQAIHPRMSYIVNAVADNDIMQSHGPLRPAANSAKDITVLTKSLDDDIGNKNGIVSMGYSSPQRGQQPYTMWNMEVDEAYLTDTVHLISASPESSQREPELSVGPASLPAYAKGGTLSEIYSGIVNDLDVFERNLKRLEHDSYDVVNYRQPQPWSSLEDQGLLNYDDLSDCNTTLLNNDEERRPGDVLLSANILKTSYTLKNSATDPLGSNEESMAVDYASQNSDDPGDAYILTEELSRETKPINFYISSQQTSRASTPAGVTDADKWEAGLSIEQEPDSDGSSAPSETERHRDNFTPPGPCGDVETICDGKIQLVVIPHNLSVLPEGQQENLVFDEKTSAGQAAPSAQAESEHAKTKNLVALTGERTYGQENLVMEKQGDSCDAAIDLHGTQPEFGDRRAHPVREFCSVDVDHPSDLEVEEIQPNEDKTCIPERRVYLFSQSLTISIDAVQLEKPPSAILRYPTDVIVPLELQVDIDSDSQPLMTEKPPEFEEKPTSVDDLCTPVLPPHELNKTWKSELNEKTAYSLKHHFSDELLQEQDQTADLSSAINTPTSDLDLALKNCVAEEVCDSPFSAKGGVTSVSVESSLSGEDSQSNNKTPVDLEKNYCTELAPESIFGLVTNGQLYHSNVETPVCEVSSPTDQAAPDASNHGETRKGSDHGEIGKGSSVFELVSNSSSEDSQTESITESGEYFTSREPYYIVEEPLSTVEAGSDVPPAVKKSEALQDAQASEENTAQRSNWRLADHVSPGELAETTDVVDLSLNCPDILQHALHKIFEEERMAERSVIISHGPGADCLHHIMQSASDLTIEKVLEESHLKTSVFDLVPGQSEPVVHDPHLPSSAVHRILKPSGQRSWYQLADLPVIMTHLSDQNLKRIVDIQNGEPAPLPISTDGKVVPKSLSTHSCGFGLQNQDNPIAGVMGEEALSRRVIAGVTSHGDAVIPEPKTSESGEPTQAYLKRFDELVGFKKEWMYDKTMIEPYAHLVDVRRNEEGADEPTAVFLYPCLLPDHADPDYEKLMENLLMYVLSNVQKIEHAPYRIIFFNSGIPHGCEPSPFWLQRVYKAMDETMKQNLIELLIVHPHFKIKAQLQTAGRAILSKDFFRKIKFVQGLKELGRMLSIQYAAIPKPVRDHDRKREWKLSKACC